MAAEVKVVATYVGASLDKGLKDLQGNLAKTAVAANKLDSSLSKDFVKGSNSAAFALQNLGRVAQDAPYGFIGISNNINPLLESFQRLKAESGSTGGALKALGASLIGGGGIGLAVSVVTSLISFASIGLQAWKGRNTDAKVAVDANKKATEDYGKALEKVGQEGFKTGIVLQNFANIAKNQTLSLETRNQALKEVNKLLGEHAEKLTLASINTEAATKVIETFTQATIQQALATKYADRASDLFINQKEAAKAYGKELDILKQLQKQTLSYENAQGVTVLTDVGKRVQKQQRTVAEMAGNYRSVTKELQNITGELSAAQLEASKLFGIISPSDTEKKDILKPKKVAKDAQTIADVLADLAKQIDFLNKKEVVFNTNETKGKLSAYFSTIEKLIKDFKPSKNLIDSLFFDAGDIKIKNALKTIREGIIEAPIEIPVTVGFEFKKSFTPEDIKEQEAMAYLQGVGVTKAMQDGINVGIEALRFPQLIALAKSTEEQIAAITELMKSSFAGAAEQFGMAIGAAIGGSGNFLRDALGGVFSIMGDFLVQLGKAAIITSKLFLAIKASKVNPFAGIIGGIAAIAAGTILKNIKLPGFATGGTTPGGSILVGERGPEIISAPRGSVITPNAQTNAILGGNGGGRLTGEFVVRGNDLVLALNRATASNRRNGQ